MVRVGSACWRVDDAALVKLECLLVGLDGDGDWSIVQCVEKGVLVVGLDILAGFEVCGGLAIGAGSLLSLVRVVILSAHAVLDGVAEGIVHDAAITAVVAICG